MPAAEPVKKRGRPPGSKNKVTVAGAGAAPSKSKSPAPKKNKQAEEAEGPPGARPKREQVKKPVYTAPTLPSFGGRMPKAKAKSPATKARTRPATKGRQAGRREAARLGQPVGLVPPRRRRRSRPPRTQPQPRQHERAAVKGRQRRRGLGVEAHGGARHPALPALLRLPRAPHVLLLRAA